MPSGLQIWNQSGQMILDYTDKVLNLVGSSAFAVPANASSASGVIKAEISQGTFFFFVVPVSQYAASGKVPSITYNNSRGEITWRQPSTVNIYERTYNIFWGFF